MDDSIEEKRKLEKLTDMPAVDMSMPDGGASVGENLEVDDDDDEAFYVEVTRKDDGRLTCGCGGWTQTGRSCVHIMAVKLLEECGPVDTYIGELFSSVCGSV